MTDHCDTNEKPKSGRCRLHRHEAGRVLRSLKVYTAAAVVVMGAELLALPGSIAKGEAGLADLAAVAAVLAVNVGIAWARDNNK